VGLHGRGDIPELQGNRRVPVEGFLEGIEGKAALKDRKVFYVIEDLKKEEFLSNPKKTMAYSDIRPR
jgi:hypothetical protein